MTITAEISEYPVPAHMIDKAADIVTSGQVETLGMGRYRIRNQYTAVIRDGKWECDCPSTIRCSHMLAALHVHTEA